ncbi:MAG: phosphotransferase [Candidatus Babeliales bacterium]
MHIWAQTININQDLAKQLIESQTNLKVVSIKIFGEGWDNIVYLINNEYVFRFARRQMGVTCMENEIAVLPYIAKNVSFSLSSPQIIGQPSNAYPYFFSGYRILPGEPLSETQAHLINNKIFAETLALWLKELHGLNIPQSYNSLIKGDQSWRLDVPGRIETCKKTISDYAHYFLQADFDKNDLFIALDILGSFNFAKAEKASFVHGDLYSRHILVDENMNPTGIIDWGDIHIGNPGIDLSIGFMLFDQEAQNVFFNTYGNIDNQTKKIAIFRALTHSIRLLPYCYENKDEHLKDWTILALKKVFQELNT